MKINSPAFASRSIAVVTRANTAALLYSCALIFPVFALLFGPSSFWSAKYPAFLNLTQGCVIGALCGILALWCGGLARPKFNTEFVVAPFFLALLGWFFMDASSRPYAWFHGVSIRGEILVSGVIGLLLFMRAPRATTIGIAVLALCLPIVAFFSFLGDRLLISDDHASFFYRLSLLKSHFPFIPFYNTDWNGGYDARDFFATGALNVYPVFTILTRLLSLESAYNVTAAWITFLLPALSVFWATKIFTRSYLTASLAATLAASSGLIWFRWSLVYGTLGFCTSTALLPLVMALTWRAINEPETFSKKIWLALFVALWTVFLLWPGSIFMIPPLVLYGLCRLRTVASNRRLLLVGVLIACINLPWMFLFTKVSQVGSFVVVTHNVTGAAKEAVDQKRAALGARAVQGDVSFKHTVKSIREQVGSTNPLLPLLVIPGLLLTAKRSRYLIGGTIGYLLLIGTVLAPLKPHLELERMALTAAIFSSIAAAIAFGWLVDRLAALRTDTRLFYRIATLIAAIVPVGMLCTSPFVSAAAGTNRTILQFFVSDSVWNGVQETFRRFGKDNGRILFSGFLLHELDGGHAAPLPAITGTAAVASSQFHNLWTYRQVFPKSFIERGDAGINEYLDMLNIGGIFAHERQWRDYFAARPSQYRLDVNHGRFAFYRRLQFNSNYVQEGSVSELTVLQDRITLVPSSASVVLKFNYLPFLQSSGCVMTGKQVAPEIKLIQLYACTPGKEITIRSISALNRLLS